MKLFGTDGIRGRANVAPMTPEILTSTAVAAGNYFTKSNRRHLVVIAKDTRLSGYMIEPALVAGFTSVGMNVMLLGPLPTPAVSMLVRSLRADLGVMISASHNPFYDNGLKFFGPDGFKLSNSVESIIEKQVIEKSIIPLAGPNDLGRASRLEGASGRYIEFVKNTFSRKSSLNEMKIVLDCANGAAYNVAPRILWELGAEVSTIGIDPDGLNINHGVGALSTQAMQEEVVKQGADIGISLDGDADRVVMADEKGRLLNGDQLMAIIARSWAKAGTLKTNTVVGTIMSNLGLETHLRDNGLHLARTPVGDRHVSQYMREHGCNLGGEQSGHIILSDYTRTGDGLIATLQVLAVLKETDKPVSEVAHVFNPVPQFLHNVRVKNKDAMENQKVQALIEQWNTELDQSERLLVRKSGTEPVVRIMVEGSNEDRLNTVINSIVEKMESENLIATENAS